MNNGAEFRQASHHQDVPFWPGPGGGAGGRSRA